MRQGNIVLLNGTSSAGKSTIARALQHIMDEPYMHTGIDFFLPRFPARIIEVSDGMDPAQAPYLLLVYRDGAQRIVAAHEGSEAVYGNGVLSEVRIGPDGVRLLSGMYRSVAALGATGINVILDDVIHDRRVLDVAVEALHASNVLFVGLRVPLDVAEQRERARGDRGPGGASAFYDLVHAHGAYDLELDTAQLSAVACASRIKEALQSGAPRAALARLASRSAQ